MKAVEDENSLKGVSLDELNLIPNLVIPLRFKTLKFEKYNGTTCLEMHLDTVTKWQKMPIKKIGRASCRERV